MLLEFCNICLKWHEAGNCETEHDLLGELRAQLQPKIDAIRESERITEDDLKLIVGNNKSE